MHSKICLLLFLAGIMACPLPCFSKHPDPKIWEPLGPHFYYNKKIITTSPDLMLVWTYHPVPDDVRAKRVEDISKYDAAKAVKYQRHHHEAVLWNLDCKNRVVRMEEIIDFDSQGMALGRYRYDQKEWSGIVPGSAGDRLYRKVCTPRDQPVRKKK